MCNIQLWQMDLSREIAKKTFFFSQICARNQISNKSGDAAIRTTSKDEDEHQSLKENARSLIVNYHGEASNHGRGNSTKQLFSPSTHSRFLEVLSEFTNFAAQGLCEGTPVVSRSCRCSEQIGCIFEWLQQIASSDSIRFKIEWFHPLPSNFPDVQHISWRIPTG